MAGHRRTDSRLGVDGAGCDGGLTPNFAELTCVLLGEYLLHGYDVATAPPALPIDPDQAALVVTAYRMAYPLTFQPAAAAGLRADPVTALLVQSGRLSQWAAVALGRLTFAGPHPELGPRFAELFVFP